MSCIRSIALASLIAATTGCASIVGDTTHPVAIGSSPAGASFDVKDESGVVVHSGTTPNTIMLKSGNGYFDGADYVVTFHKEGFEDQQVTLESSVYGWYWGNILFGGLIGLLIVDPMTGAMYTLPENSHSTLNPTSQPATAKSDLTLLTIDQIPAAERDQLIRVN